MSSENESDDDTENSSEGGPEMEPIEIQKRYFPINPYKHYIDTGDTFITLDVIHS